MEQLTVPFDRGEGAFQQQRRCHEGGNRSIRFGSSSRGWRTWPPLCRLGAIRHCYAAQARRLRTASGWRSVLVVLHTAYRPPGAPANADTQCIRWHLCSGPASHPSLCLSSPLPLRTMYFRDLRTHLCYAPICLPWKVLKIAFCEVAVKSPATVLSISHVGAGPT